MTPKIPQDVGALKMLYAAASDEVREKDVSGKHLTPYGYVNSATDGKAAGSEALAGHFWDRSMEICKEHVPEFQTPKI